jgi:uncharacterized membrane protein
MQEPSISAPVQTGVFSGRPVWALAVAACALVVGGWLSLTPPGLLGKADAVGYAICHRIDLRSFNIGDRQMPLCARCTGIYLGALGAIGVLAALGHSRSGALPTTPMLVVLIIFVGLMGVDGINSYAGLFPGLPQLYQPANELRLITGTLCGLAVGALLYPVFNQTLWRGWTLRPVVSRPVELAALVTLGAVIVVLVMSGDPNVLYVLALLSAAGVVLLLAMLYTAGLLMVTRRDARAESWRAAALPLLLGFTLAIAHSAAMDAARYAIFGSWTGLPLGG